MATAGGVRAMARPPRFLFTPVWDNYLGVIASPITVWLAVSFGWQFAFVAIGVRLFDAFTGAGVGEGMKSLALEVTLQPADKSYAEADLKAIAERITAAAAKLGAALRG